jgi:hypothetical protein
MQDMDSAAEAADEKIWKATGLYAGLHLLFFVVMPASKSLAVSFLGLALAVLFGTVYGIAFYSPFALRRIERGRRPRPVTAALALTFVLWLLSLTAVPAEAGGELLARMFVAGTSSAIIAALVGPHYDQLGDTLSNLGLPSLGRG